MTTKKNEPSAPEGTGADLNEEIERLRADNARLLAAQKFDPHPSWTTDDEVKQLLSFPTTHPAHQRPLPPMKYIAVQLASCHSCATFMCSIGSNSREHRLIKIDWPGWIDATLGPALRFQPDAQRCVDVETMNGLGIEARAQGPILACEADKAHTHDSALPYERITAMTTELFGRGKRGHHARIHRLQLPAYRLAGLTESEARVYCKPGRFEDIPEGSPLPVWWEEALRPTGEGVVVYEAHAQISKTFSRPEKDEAPRIIGKPDAYPRY